MSDVRVPDLNTVTVAGRLTRDPDLKYVSSGRAVCEISIANTKYYKTRDGERKEDTTFINATCWDKFAEYVGENLKKGRPVIIEGRLKSESWEDKNSGQKRSKVYILANRVTPLDWENSEGRESGGGRPQAQSQRPAPREIEEPIPEDDIPF